MTTTADPCRHCGSGSFTDDSHVYGQRKCCPDCDHRPADDPIRDALARVLRPAEPWPGAPSPEIIAAALLPVVWELANRQHRAAAGRVACWLDCTAAKCATRCPGRLTDPDVDLRQAIVATLPAHPEEDEEDTADRLLAGPLAAWQETVAALQRVRAALDDLATSKDPADRLIVRLLRRALDGA